MSNSIPNWQHHSRKEAKRKLKPQALRSARERRRHLKKRLLTPKRGFFRVQWPYNKEIQMPVQQEIKSQLAKLLATEDIIVEHKHVQTASFNVDSRVLVLPLWKKR